MKKSSHVFLVASALLLSFTLSGCIAAVRHNEPPVTVTVGQQLIDLQKAKDAGVINDSEFQTQRAKFLSQK
jgi:hypothetical protein